MKIAIIGTGNLGRSIAKGLIINNAITSLYLTRRSLDNLKEFDGYKNVFTTTTNGMIYSSLDPRWQGKTRRLICHKISVEYCMTYFDDY